MSLRDVSDVKYTIHLSISRQKSQHVRKTSCNKPCARARFENKNLPPKAGGGAMPSKKLKIDWSTYVALNANGGMVPGPIWPIVTCLKISTQSVKYEGNQKSKFSMQNTISITVELSRVIMFCDEYIVT